MLKRIFLIAGVIACLFGVIGQGEAGFNLYENEKLDLKIGISDATAWIGVDVLHKETVSGLKSSIVKYGIPFNMSVNFDIGIFGTQIEEISDIDGIVGLSLALPEPKEWKGNIYMDVGIAYSPDWITGPERLIVYGGIKTKF